MPSRTPEHVLLPSCLPHSHALRCRHPPLRHPSVYPPSTPPSTHVGLAPSGHSHLPSTLPLTSCPCPYPCAERHRRCRPRWWRKTCPCGRPTSLRRCRFHLGEYGMEFSKMMVCVHSPLTERRYQKMLSEKIGGLENCHRNLGSCRAEQFSR